MNGAISRAVLGCGIAFATLALHQPIPATLPAERDEVFLPRPAFAKIASLGFDAVLSDYYWIQAMFKVGNSLVHDENFTPYIGKIIDLVTTLDPYVGHAYRFAAIWMVDTPEDVRKANRLLERGIEYHPDEWRNYFYLGFNYFYYLGETERAAAILEQCSQFEASPGYLPRLVARLRSESADLETAALFLQELVQDTSSEKKLAMYRAALDEIEVEMKARFLDRARAAYQKLQGRDIEEVLDLVTEPHPVLAALPPPQPDALPETLRKGDRWVLDPKTGSITSTYYGRRYRVNSIAQDRNWNDGQKPALVEQGEEI